MYKSILIQLKKDPGLLFGMFLNFFKSDFTCRASFLSNDELLVKVREGKSIIRLGDGDMGIMHGKNIFHQEYNKELETGLRKIISNYSDLSNYILLIPKFVNVKNSILRAGNILICWLPFKTEFIKSFNKDVDYGDAHIFYYLEPTLKLFNMFLNKEKVLFVTNKTIIDKLNARGMNHNSTFFVETPVERTFDVLNDVYKKIDIILKADDNIKIFLACGCSSRIIAYHYSKLGYQCIDVGTGIRSYLENKDFSIEI